MTPNQNQQNLTTTTQKKRPGAPTKYTPEAAQLFCALIASGLSLAKIDKLRKSKDPKDAALFANLPNGQASMPASLTFVDYYVKNSFPEFTKGYERARAIQCEIRADQIVDIAMDAKPAEANLAKVQVDAVKWVLSKLNPGKYGDRQHLFIQGELSITTAQDQAPDWIRDKVDAATVINPDGTPAFGAAASVK